MACGGLTLGFIAQEAVDLGGGTVVGTNSETVIGNIEDQILAHDGQTDKAEVSTRDGARRGADIDAGKTSAFVSNRVLLSIAC